MAYEAKKLNNIAGSTGKSNFWVYSDAGAPLESPPDAGNTLATIDADNYFAASTAHGVRLNDCFLLVGTDGCALGWMGTLTATTSIITTVTAIT